MPDESTVFYLRDGKIPCDKFCRKIRQTKNVSVYNFHSMLYVTVKMIFEIHCIGFSVPQSRQVSIF